MDFGAPQQVSGIRRNGNDSGTWPVLLVRKKKALLVSPELDAAWFGRDERESEFVDLGEPGSFQLVSRRRLRWAHALFVLAFGAVAALLIWEARTHFGV